MLDCIILGMQLPVSGKKKQALTDKKTFDQGKTVRGAKPGNEIIPACIKEKLRVQVKSVPPSARLPPRESSPGDL